MGCEKSCYATRAVARKFAKGLKRNQGKAFHRLYAYWCSKCSAWHLTSREAYVSRQGVVMNDRVV